MRRTGNASLLRRVNRSAVLELLRTAGPLPRAEIARRLQLSAPTITRIAAALLEDGLVLERETIDSTGGRPATLLQFNPRASLVIGIYIGQSIVGALADLSGEIIRRHSAPALPGRAGITQVVKVIEALRRNAVEMAIPVRGVGVGAPSIVTYPEGIVVWSPSLGWRNVPLQQMLQQALDLPVFVENEVNLIALGERWQGAGRGIENMICISLGDGIGAGLVLNGRLYRGSHSASGEVGYLIPGQQFLGRVYDTYGCLEGLAGSSGIVRRAQARLAAGEPSMLANAANGTGASLSVDMVLAAARQNDALARAVLQETIDYLSIAVANLACILDPDRIVVSGDLAAYGELFIDALCARLQGLVPNIPPLVLSELQMDAPVLGAVATVLSETSTALFVRPN